MAMKPLCEAIVIDVFPTVRSILAMKLTKLGLKNKEIAERMGVTPAAVTQYLKKARGSRVKALMSNKAVDREITALAKRMAKKPLSAAESVRCFCDICGEVRRQRIVCRMHSGPEGCMVCLP